MKYKQFGFWVLAIMGLLALITMFPIAVGPVFSQDAVAVADDIPLPPNPLPTEWPAPLSYVFVFILPFVVQNLKKLIKSSKARFILAVVLSIVSGVLAALVSGLTLNWANSVIFIFAVFGYGQLAWGIFKYLYHDGKVVDPATGKVG